MGHFRDIFEACEKRLQSVRESLSKDEFGFIKETIKSKKIPSLTLLVKDHKKVDENGDYPCRLIIPATNFTAGFSNVGYRGIKKTS